MWMGVGGPTPMAPARRPLRWIELACLASLCASASKLDRRREYGVARPTEACPAGVEVRWKKPLRSFVYATPVLTGCFGEDGKNVLVPSFQRYLELVRGSDGEDLPGWPVVHESDVHASPLLYDVDEDGVMDVLLATYDGQVLAYKDNGESMEGFRFLLPPVRVRWNWYAGLKSDHVDHQDPDVGKLDTFTGDQGGDLLSDKEIMDELRGILHELDGRQGTSAEEGSARQRMGRTLMQEVTVERGEHVLSEEASLSFDVFGEASDERSELLEARVGEIREDDAGLFETTSSEQWDTNGKIDRNLGHRDGKGRDEAFWEEEEVGNRTPALEDGHVRIDAHVLCTPAIGDIDGDGDQELVVSVSHFFDQEHYDNPRFAWQVQGLDTSKYLATSVVVYNLHDRSVKWQQHLDLSTESTFFRAYAYSAPTLVDLDNDGKLEIVLGTSVGFLYVLNSDGSTRAGWPVEMGDIQAQVVASDVDLDGGVELIAVDTRGDVVAIRGDTGEKLWERHLKAVVSQPVLVADVNGDGVLEVVVGTSSGHIHVLQGKDGKPLLPFPFHARGRIDAPILPLKLVEGREGLHLVVLASDGILYMVDGITGCADVRELGESSYSMVLADDLDEDGRMDLIATTMHGNMYLLDTLAPSHPLKAWTGPTSVFRYDWYGVYALEESRRVREVGSRTLTVRFRIEDRRPLVSRAPGDSKSSRTYRVRLALVARSSTGSETPWSLVTEGSYPSPGVYVMEVGIPPFRAVATVSLSCEDDRNASVADSFTLHLHTRPGRLLKWLYAGPFLLFIFWVSAWGTMTYTASLPT